jgi:hypothetical protein
MKLNPLLWGTEEREREAFMITNDRFSQIFQFQRFVVQRFSCHQGDREQTEHINANSQQMLFSNFWIMEIINCPNLLIFSTETR